MDMFPNAAAGGAAAAEPADDGKMVNLSEKIDAKDCYARNEDAAFPMSNLFIGDSRLGCKSDTDEQLILHIAFNEFVKVRGRRRRTPGRDRRRVCAQQQQHFSHIQLRITHTTARSCNIVPLHPRLFSLSSSFEQLSLSNSTTA